MRFYMTALWSNQWGLPTGDSIPPHWQISVLSEKQPQAPGATAFLLSGSLPAEALAGLIFQKVLQ